MHAVILGRQRGDVAAACEAAARQLGRSQAEVRSRLALVGDDPLVIAATREAAAAREAADVLVAHGFDARLLDVRRPFAALVAARAFQLRSDTIAANEGDGADELAWAAVEAIVVGSRARPSPHAPLVQVRSAHRITDAIAQPLLVREEVVASAGDEQLAFLVAGDRALVLAEDRLAYRSLGAAVQPSRRANFRYLVQFAVDRCPGVPCDHRLERPHTRAHILGPIVALDRGLEVAAAIVADDVRRAARDPYR